MVGACIGRGPLIDPAVALDHPDEKNSAFGPPHPADAPAIDAVADSSGHEPPQELRLDFRGNTWMALARWRPP